MLQWCHYNAIILNYVIQLRQRNECSNFNRCRLIIIISGLCRKIKLVESIDWQNTLFSCESDSFSRFYWDELEDNWIVTTLYLARVWQRDFCYSYVVNIQPAAVLYGDDWWQQLLTLVIILVPWIFRLKDNYCKDWIGWTSN